MISALAVTNGDIKTGAGNLYSRMTTITIAATLVMLVFVR
jgi:hypothetical protein